MTFFHAALWHSNFRRTFRGEEGKGKHKSSTEKREYTHETLMKKSRRKSRMFGVA
jgi:hypothetical protein